jgi:uncharacterized protein with ACT and thioredoxin-like domain
MFRCLYWRRSSGDCWKEGSICTRQNIYRERLAVKNMPVGLETVLDEAVTTVNL